MPVLVLELVDGETIEDRLGKGPIPLDEAIGIALQVAEALEAAHDRGIVHRDLKPANVKIARDGKVKVLDFGLAKALDQDGSSGLSDPTLSPTLTSGPATAMGLIMGTAAYMSPEQARGKPVDRRADIWAFGALLYEMLAGVRPFPGETVSDTLAAGPDVDARLDAVAPRYTRSDQDTPRAVSGEGSAAEASGHRRGTDRAERPAGTGSGDGRQTRESCSDCCNRRRRTRIGCVGRCGADAEEVSRRREPRAAFENST